MKGEPRCSGDGVGVEGVSRSRSDACGKKKDGDANDESGRTIAG